MKIIFLFLITISFLFSIEIFDVTNKNAKIDMANITVGSSGIIVRKVNNNYIILTQAIVTKSDDINTTIKFIDKQIIPQDSIPTSKIKPSNGDDFILNHLYNTSLLIVPNIEAKNELLKLYPKHNFLNEDFFAAHLKVIDTPLPTKKIISQFTQSQEIGTIFLVIKNKLYIIDTLTFKIIDTQDLQYNNTTTNVPFFTKVRDIKKGFWNFGPEKIKNYNKYYLKLIGKDDDR
ncbi:MAG: hypothetical protein CSA86_02425 [Arcobacter sp.]|nr:MAG: hypothetical protein CSA86_02425 [Arcobacter sp.]